MGWIWPLRKSLSIEDVDPAIEAIEVGNQVEKSNSKEPMIQALVELEGKPPPLAMVEERMKCIGWRGC